MLNRTSFSAARSTLINSGVDTTKAKNAVGQAAITQFDIEEDLAALMEVIPATRRDVAAFHLDRVVSGTYNQALTIASPAMTEPSVAEALQVEATTPMPSVKTETATEDNSES